MFAAANSLVTRAGAPPLRDAGLSDDTAAGRGKGHLSLFLKNFKFTPVLEAISRFCRKPEPPIVSSSEFTKSVKRRSPQPMSCLEPIKLASALSPSRWTNRRRFTAQNENQRGGLIHSFSPKSSGPAAAYLLVATKPDTQIVPSGRSDTPSSPRPQGGCGWDPRTWVPSTAFQGQKGNRITEQRHLTAADASEALVVVRRPDRE